MVRKRDICRNTIWNCVLFQGGCCCLTNGKPGHVTTLPTLPCQVFVRLFWVTGRTKRRGLGVPAPRLGSIHLNHLRVKYLAFWIGGSLGFFREPPPVPREKLPCENADYLNRIFERRWSVSPDFGHSWEDSGFMHLLNRDVDSGIVG